MIDLGFVNEPEEARIDRSDGITFASGLVLRADGDHLVAKGGGVDMPAPAAPARLFGDTILADAIVHHWSKPFSCDGEQSTGLGVIRLPPK